MDLVAKMIALRLPLWFAIPAAAVILIIVWLNWKRLQDALGMFRRK